jgi:hypothetical protein
MQFSLETSVWFVDVDEKTEKVVFLPYQSVGHLRRSFKFLFWFGLYGGKNLLFVGSSEAKLSRHSALLTAIKFDPEYGRLIRDNPKGAGDIYRSQVASWESIDFALITPPELQPFILEALGINP